MLLVAVPIAVIGCSKDVGRDMANCKVKAMEAYKPASVETDDRAAQYVLNCMLAAGYQLTSVCMNASNPAGWTYFSCYQ
jgi:hypothetical protein